MFSVKSKLGVFTYATVTYRDRVNAYSCTILVCTKKHSHKHIFQYTKKHANFHFFMPFLVMSCQSAPKLSVVISIVRRIFRRLISSCVLQSQQNNIIHKHGSSDICGRRKN